MYCLHFLIGYNCNLLSFQPSLDNIHALVHSFTNSSQARREGLKFQDIVYECVRADRFSVYAKHVSVTGQCDVSIDVEQTNQQMNNKQLCSLLFVTIYYCWLLLLYFTQSLDHGSDFGLLLWEIMEKKSGESVLHLTIRPSGTHCRTFSPHHGLDTGRLHLAAT